MARRKGISDRVRFEVFKRDGFRCKYCGATALSSALSLDHVVPHSKGGSDDPANLVTACVPCNGGKSDVPLEQSQLAPAADPAAIRAHAAQVREFLAAARELDEARQGWREFVAERWGDITGYEARPAIVTILVNAISSHGLERFEEALGAVAKKRLRGESAERYFCGVIRKMAEEADSPAVDYEAVIANLQLEIEDLKQERNMWEEKARDYHRGVTQLFDERRASRGAELGG